MKTLLLAISACLPVACQAAPTRALPGNAVSVRVVDSRSDASTDPTYFLPDLGVIGGGREERALAIFPQRRERLALALQQRLTGVPGMLELELEVIRARAGWFARGVGLQMFADVHLACRLRDASGNLLAEGEGHAGGSRGLNDDHAYTIPRYFERVLVAAVDDFLADLPASH